MFLWSGKCQMHPAAVLFLLGLASGVVFRTAFVTHGKLFQVMLCCMWVAVTNLWTIFFVVLCNCCQGLRNKMAHMLWR